MSPHSRIGPTADRNDVFHIFSRDLRARCFALPKPRSFVFSPRLDVRSRQTANQDLDLVTSNISRIPLRTAIVALSIHTVVAADGVWTNPAGGSWAEATNWASATIADGSGAIADFSTLDLAANAAVTLDGARTIGTLRFADTTVGSDWSLAAGTAGPLTLAGASKPVIHAGSGTTTISTALAGTQGFEKTGAGVLVLSGVNTFTGSLLISQGTVRAASASALGAGSTGNETIVASGAAFDMNGQQLTNTEVYRLAGTGPTGAGAFVNMGGGQQNGVNKINLYGNATIGGTGRWDVRTGEMPTIDLAGFTLTKVGTNQISFVGRDLITTAPAEPDTTITAVMTAGNLVINEGVFAIENTASADASGSITINSPGIFGLWANKPNRVTRPIISNNGTIQNLGSDATLNSPVVIAGNALNITGTASTHMAGIISGAGNLLKTGTGNFNFTGANTFVGKTVVSGGYFGTRTEAVFGAVPAAYQQDLLTLDGGSLGTVSGGFFVANGGPVFNGNRGVTFGVNGGGFDVYGHANARSRVLISNPIVGPGGLRKSGGGYLTLEAANSFEGATTISDGPAISDTVPYAAIQIANYDALSTGAVTFTNGGAINGLRFLTSGTLNNPITLSPTAGSATGFIVDPGKTATLGGLVEGGTFEGAQVHVNGGGTLVIPDDKTYSSATRVTGGRLIVNGDLVDSDTTVAANGAIGGTGMVRTLVLEEGSKIIASSPPLAALLGVTANKAEGGKGVEVLVTNSPATPGTRTVDVVDYGDDPENPIPEIANFSTTAYRSALFQDDAANHKITLTYTNSTRTWGGAAGIWDVATTGSWVEDDHKFFQGDAVSFGNPAAEQAVTLTGALAPSAITVDNTNNYLFNGTGTIASGSLTKSGTGMLVLATGNNYAGGTTINGGTISLSSNVTTAGGNAGALGTGAVTVNAGGTLKLWVTTGGTSYYENALTLNGGKVLAEDGINVINNLVTLGATGGTVSAKWNGKNLVFAKPISGSGKLTAQREVPSGEADASVILAAANTYTGGTDIFSGVVRVANSDQALGTGTVTFTGAASLATAQNGGARTVANTIVIASGITGSFSAGFAPLTIAGNVSGPGTLQLTSTGTVALSGTNSHAATTLAGTGLLRLDSPGALGTTGVITFNGGALQASAANTTDYSARFSTTATGQGFRLNTNGQAVTWASPLTGATGSLWKLGEGTLSVTGASTFGGGTNVQGGVLETALIADTGATPLGTFSTAGGSFLSFGGGTLRYTGPTAMTTRYLWSDQSSGGIEVTNAATTLTFSATAGTVNRPFTKSGPGTLTLADSIDGTATVTVTGGTLNLNGTNTYTGLTTISAGTLAMATASLPNGGDVRITTGATLQLGFTGEDLIDQLFIDGVEKAKGTWGGTASAAEHKTPLITGPGILNVQTGTTGGGGGGGYDAWANTSGLTAANNGKSMDPDGDGLSNLGEFAFDDAALSGKSSGKVVLKKATIDGKDYLTLTLPVLTGATFNEEMVSNAVSGVIYTIQGSEDLSAFTLEVVEVTGTDAAAIQADLPDLTSEDWTYRTFRPVTEMSVARKQFLRALADEPQ